MRYQYRFTKKERARTAALESILADTATSPRERMSALRALERIEAAARRRAEAAPTNEAAPPAQPTVDDLVSALEKVENGQKQPSQPLSNQVVTGGQNGQNASSPVGVDLRASNAADKEMVTPTPETTAVAFCGFCQAPGQWNTTAGGVILCPTCFGKVCAADMRAASARSLARDPGWLYEKGEDPNTNDLADLRDMGRDFQNSVRIWEQQAREDADRQEREAADRAAATERLNRERAEYISLYGRLAPHDQF